MNTPPAENPLSAFLAYEDVAGDSPRQGVSTMLIVRVPDVDEHYRRAREAGAEIVIAATDEPWGVRRYQARDPEGHQWQFEQPLG